MPRFLRQQIRGITVPGSIGQLYCARDEAHRGIPDQCGYHRQRLRVAVSMTANSPSSRWTAEHGHGRRKRSERKRVYRSWWMARLTVWRLNRRHADTLEVYSCYWGDDYRNGETAPRHWHLGHEPKRAMWGY